MPPSLIFPAAPPSDSSSEIVRLSHAEIQRVVRAEYAAPYSSSMRPSGGPGRSDLSGMRLTWKDRFDVVGLMVRFDQFTYDRVIEEFFAPEFFETDFWQAWSSGFAFRPWHAALEFKRYLWLHIHDLPRIEPAGAPALTQADSLVAAFIRHIREHGFCFGPEASPAASGLLLPYAGGTPEPDSVILRSGGLRALCRPQHAVR